MIQNRILWIYLFIVKDKENQDSSQAVFQLCTFVMRQALYWKFHSGRHQTQSPASRAGLIQARSLNQACVSFVQQSKTSSTFPFLGQSSYLRNNVGDYDHNDLHRHHFAGKVSGRLVFCCVYFLLIFFFWWFDFYFVFIFWWFWRSCSSSASPLCGEGVGRADEWAGLVYQQIGVSGGPAC